ncbi:MAG: dTDP-4-dehydrorhamnose reductase [Solirubrobacterales bacterium]|nr:dTDP-4-dehydrorhamnose reductase [Solirubrobacterales bacterium]MCB8915462.1 dTDP-4-dehydrorhamnose reductase [Thermoleophilales bacterium]
MKITVLGARGMLGHDVMLAAENEGHEVSGYGHSEVDITDPEAVGRRLRLDQPDAVVNCAAWTDVDGAEDELEGAMAVNGTGAGIVAEAAAAVDAKVLYVSSDYVFDGTKTEPYLETDQTGPVSAYGTSKLAGEVATMNANRRSFVVRSSWLFGIAGGNFVDTMIRLGNTQKQVLVVRDQVGCPTYTWHLAYGLVRLLDSDAYGIHHMAGGGHCSWYDFAKEIFKMSGMEVTTLSATTEMFNAKAPRPAWSVLESGAEHAITLPDWQDGLAAYLEQRRSVEGADS